MLEVDGKRYIVDKFTGKWSVPLGAFSMFLKKKVYRLDNYQALDSLIKQSKKENGGLFFFIFIIFAIFLGKKGLSSLFETIFAFLDSFKFAISANTVTIINLSITVVVGLVFAFLLYREKRSLEKLIDMQDWENTYVHIPLRNKLNRQLFYFVLKMMIVLVVLIIATLVFSYFHPSLLCFAFFTVLAVIFFVFSIAVDWRQENSFVFVDDYLE